MTKPTTGPQRRTRKIWTHAELARLRALYPDTPMPELRALFNADDTQIYYKATGMGLRRSVSFLRTAAACALARPEHAAAVQTNRVGRDRREQNLLPMGTERVTALGVRVRRVATTGNRATDWRPVYELAFIARYGPIPDGYVLRVTNGDYQADSADHVQLISRADVLAGNSITNHPPEVRSALRTLGHLKRAIKGRTE